MACSLACPEHWGATAARFSIHWAYGEFRNWCILSNSGSRGSAEKKKRKENTLGGFGKRSELSLCPVAGLEGDKERSRERKKETSLQCPVVSLKKLTTTKKKTKPGQARANPACPYGLAIRATRKPYKKLDTWFIPRFHFNVTGVPFFFVARGKCNLRTTEWQLRW